VAERIDAEALGELEENVVAINRARRLRWHPLERRPTWTLTQSWPFALFSLL
jgi:hypothetical protein